MDAVLGIVCAVGLLSSTAGATNLSLCPCESGVNVPISVDIKNCDKAPCLLHRGTNVTWSMVFQADEDHEKVAISFYGTCLGMNYPYPGIDGMIVDNSIYSVPDNAKVDSPLQKGRLYRHEMQKQIPLGAPKVRMIFVF